MTIQSSKGTNKQVHNRGLRDDGPKQTSLEQSELTFQPSNRYEDSNQGQEKLEKSKIQRIESEKEKKKSEAQREKNHRHSSLTLAGEKMLKKWSRLFSIFFLK